MPIYASAGSGTSFTPAPAGVHSAVCVDVIDMGIVESTFDGKTRKQHKIRIAWEIDEAMEDGRRLLVQKRYTCSLHEKAALRKDLESWRGRPFTEDELRQFDLERLLGAPGMVNVVHAESGGKTYANVTSVMPLHRNMAKLAPSGQYIRVQDRTEADTATSHDQSQPPDDHDGAPPLTDDDIPFGWLMPLIGSLATFGGFVA